MFYQYLNGIQKIPKLLHNTSNVVALYWAEMNKISNTSVCTNNANEDNLDVLDGLDFPA